MSEVWRDIKGFKEQYQVSSLGRIKSKVRIVFNGRWDVTRKSKVMKPSRPNKFGYVMINLCKGGVKKHCLVHRLIAEAFIPNPENKETVNHKNGNKSDNRLKNLEWATRSEQNIHASRLGLKKFTGENHSQHKLTEQQVIEIRKRKQVPRGEEFGVTDMTIRDVINRRSWKHL